MRTETLSLNTVPPIDTLNLSHYTVTPKKPTVEDAISGPTPQPVQDKKALQTAVNDKATAAIQTAFNGSETFESGGLKLISAKLNISEKKVVATFGKSQSNPTLKKLLLLVSAVAFNVFLLIAAVVSTGVKTAIMDTYHGATSRTDVQIAIQNLHDIEGRRVPSTPH